MQADSAQPPPGSPPGISASEWEDQIAHLIDNPEDLRGAYQPVVDLRTGDCTGYEAFTRVAQWPTHSPVAWFVHASRTALAARFEAAALAATLRHRDQLPAGTFLSVNLTSRALSEPEVAGQLDALDLTALAVELADAGDLHRDGAAALAAYRDRGLLLAVGIAQGGLGDLDMLTRLAPDLVKLAPRAVKGVHADPMRARVARLLVEVAEEQGAVLLAEGIEVAEDARFLQAVGVRLGQGWLFGHPRPTFLPPIRDAVAWARESWRDIEARSRVARVALPLPRDGDPPAGDHGPAAMWAAEVGDDGRLARLRSRGGETIPASELLRVRRSATLRSAANRMLAAGSSRRPHDLMAVVDDEGHFVGVATGEDVVRGALDSPAT